MKRLLCALLFIPAVAAAEAWKCEYAGRSTVAGGRDSGAITWKLTWTSHGAGWKLTGGYNDKLGSSYLEGSCANRSCTLSQTYKSGKLDGIKYTWTGTYKDRPEGARRTVNTFKGNWQGGDKRGSWTATAICTKI